MNLPESNFPLQCRTCLKQSSNTMSIFNSERFAETVLPIYEAIMTCAPVQISIADGFPDQVCLGCLGELRRAIAFRKRCEKSEDILRNTCILIVEDCSGSDRCVDDKSGVLEKVRKNKNVRKNVNVKKRDETSSKQVNQKRPIATNVYTEIFECEKCKKRFISKGGLELHTAEYHDPKSELPKTCNICDKTFRSYSALVTHMVVHTGEKPFRCSTCGKGFGRIYDLKVHNNKIHTGENTNQCQTEECSVNDRCVDDKSGVLEKDQNDKNQINVEKRDETSSKQVNQKRPIAITLCTEFFECEMCKKRFISKKGLTLHTAEYHNPKYGVSRKCTVCNKTFSTPRNLRRHMMLHTGEKPFLCSTCGKGFTELQSFTFHSYTHTGKLFQCQTCEKRFASPEELKRHVRTHTGERPFVCEVCGERFRQSWTLKTHIWKHTGEKPFECRLCEQRFRSSTQLKTHVLTHTGEMPYKCGTCDKRFRVRQGLQQHIRTHTGEKPYCCELCGKTFAVASSLRKHKKVHEKHQRNDKDEHL